DAGQDFFSDGITEDCHHGSRPLLEPARDRQIGDFSVQGVECGSRRDRVLDGRPARKFEMMVNGVELHDRMPVVLGCRSAYRSSLDSSVEGVTSEPVSESGMRIRGDSEGFIDGYGIIKREFWARIGSNFVFAVHCRSSELTLRR